MITNHAVVKLNPGGRHDFSRWHHSETEALVEAKRLAELEKKDFAVLRLVGVMKYPKIEAHFEIHGGDNEQSRG